MLKNSLSYLLGFIILAAITVSCELITGPNYADTPRIDFKEIKKFRTTSFSNMVDSLSIALRFQDGDGDLGIPDEERGKSPYLNTDSIPDGKGGKITKYYNYYVKTFRKINGVFTPIDYSPNLTGIYPDLNSGKKGPIEGTLYYGPIFPLGFSPVNDTLRFEIFILDRAFHISNTVETSEVIINQK